MYQRKLNPTIRCPLEHVLNMIRGKWNARIICVLSYYKTLRYSDLKNELIDVTDTVLASTLKEMIENKLINRRQYNEDNEILPRVEYSLTDKGQSLVQILENFCSWSRVHSDSENEDLFKQCHNCEHI
ncbi:putative HTH-type transcriptional regulator YtcD [Neobacillus rhizosphaerae]|uniref:HTH-type transcriptional regulator YtcD n=1 Tax=Neobacillus rhizosphaerae TaxID=2880965 RepID=A0ABM9ER42_9BACI|nr:helix-turn-helix domain-containing protein [Neobacillus rhizosphaerae]CAH2715113.1 putative HTH-type transcriptional regulator YtcD [Neobacillus rhizosphaerae]